MERLAAWQASPPAAAASATTPQPQGEASPLPSALLSPLGSLDDWTPEASGIFRILRGEPARATATAAAQATAAVPSDEVPLPRRRPAAADAAVFAFVPEN